MKSQTGGFPKDLRHRRDTPGHGGDSGFPVLLDQKKGDKINHHLQQQGGDDVDSIGAKIIYPGQRKGG